MKKSYIASISVVAVIVVSFAFMAWFAKWLEAKEETEEQAFWNAPEVTIEEFNSLEYGMDYKEVVKLTGGSGGLMDKVGTRELYFFDGDQPSSFVTMTFKDGKLIDMSQVGLE
ncbi:hypothetical protein CBR56_07655 [Bacillus thuringiensis]|uniref:hypothetical protein n=1 Tax=Bacillus tropicus TaxID=2026188 RepID=UPI000B44E308|nr:hypothetical protein [Bacillus tropicus]MED3037246.1 hypothetical protein [Bacillus tropicus]OTX85121.1 hypothetical protein BK728_10865 [Bacillus thuringiensis serovar chanpaisis]PNK31469.1 hypothetical protein CBR56_07655 [Bacillus thuringiensis]